MDTFKSPTFGVLFVSGLLAGIVGFTMSRRATRQERTSAVVLDRARDLGDTELGKIGREFISGRVVPEMKPVMIDLLKEFEDYLDNYFKRAEKAIKAM